MSDYVPLGFESDLANRNFAGAQNPDDLLFVEFYWHEPLDKNKTEAAFEETGVLRPIKGERTIYIRIMKPGDKTSMIETPVREDHKRRFPKKWLYFQIQEGMIDGGADQPGWKIEEWGVLSEEEIHRLKFLRFYTVEQIAGASDAQVGTMGMGGLALRKKAREACEDRAKSFVKHELQEKDRELAEMKARLAKMEEMIFAKHEEKPAEAPKKRGRPKKSPPLTEVQA